LEEKNKIAMEKINSMIRNCRRCGLWRTRKNAVPGEGDIKSGIMFVGEAPGKNEDERGRPFVGAAGKLLNKLLEENNMRRNQIYITNIVKCRPPNNREPTKEEIEKCTSYLENQIKIIRPRIIVTLGRTATKYFLEKRGIRFKGILDARRKIFKIKINEDEALLIPTIHPAAALYNPNMKEVLKNDLKRINEILKGKTKQKQLDAFLKSKDE